MNGAIMHKLSDVMHMDLSVLGSFSLNLIIAHLNGAIIIIVDNS